jgi:predicted metal-dependent peptidase
MTFDLNKHVARLLMDEPFFAALSRKIEKKASTAIPTAGVRINPDSATFEMIYNPEFFEKLPDVQRGGVLKHEFYHLVFEHVTGRLPEEGMTKLWNIATDLSINTHLQGELPDMCCMPGVGHFAEMPGFQTAEWYFKKLQDKESEQDNEQGNSGQSGEGDEEGQEAGEQFDSHDGWSEVDENVKQMARERIKNSIRKAAEEASKTNNWGSVPSECRREIMKKLETHVDWKKVLRYFVKTSQRANKASTMKRINRRYPYIHAGRKTSRTANIAISIDQSGSVSDDMLAAFYAELNKLSSVAQFTVIPFDDQVFEEKIFVWKRGETRNRERVLCGGTNFDAPTDYVNQHGFDGHIILTDMYAPKPKPSKCQRMWMTDGYHARNPYFVTKERVIAIEAEAT